MEVLKRRKRTDSMDTLYYNNNDDDNKIEEPSDYETLLSELNELNINNNKSLVVELIKKIDKLEKYFNEINKINIKIDTMNNNIEKILIEKDYTIDFLKDEISFLKTEIKEINYNNECNPNKKINDYFC